MANTPEDFLARHHRPFGGDSLTGHGEVDELGQREESENRGDDREALPQLNVPERESVCPAEWVDADRSQQKAEGAGRQSLGHAALAEEGDHRHAKQRQHCDLDVAELEDERFDDRDGQRQGRRSDQTAHRRHGVDGSQGERPFALAGELVPLEIGDLGLTGGQAHQHRRDRVQRVVQRTHHGQEDDPDGRLVDEEQD